MSKQGAWLWGVAACCAAALVAGCDQELVLPAGATAETDAGGAPSSGITGASGIGDEVAPPGRLPVPDGPVYSTFGGEGGAGGEGGVGGEGATKASGNGGTGPAEGSGGASPPDRGAAGDAAAGSGAAVPSGPRQLFFSEYLEGSGSLKALEIYAFGPASLEGCELQTYFNGKLEPGRLALHGDLPAGGLQVLCSPALATAKPSLCDRSTNLTFNGDDALALACAGVTLDVFGQVGVDPGAAWGGATADHTLRRRCEVSEGRSEGSTPFEPSTEWLELGPDIFDDLGLYDCYAD